jgi:hypothetical protein
MATVHATALSAFSTPPASSNHPTICRPKTRSPNPRGIFCHCARRVQSCQQELALAMPAYSPGQLDRPDPRPTKRLGCLLLILVLVQVLRPYHYRPLTTPYSYPLTCTRLRDRLLTHRIFISRLCLVTSSVLPLGLSLCARILLAASLLEVPWPEHPDATPEEGQRGCQGAQYRPEQSA